MILDKIFQNEKGELIDVFDVILGSNNTKNFIYAMAEARAINLIAKTIAKTEIQVYSKNEENKKIKDSIDDIYWTLNIQPNYNENGTMFLYKLALKLIIEKRALILINEISNNRKLLYVAESFDTSKDIFKGKKFTNIKIKDDEGNFMKVKKEYNQENSIYLSVKNTNLKISKESFKKNSEELVKCIINKFKRSNTPKWKLEKPGGQPTLIDFETGKPISYEEYAKKVTNGLLSDEEAVILLSNAFNLINLNKDNNQTLSDYKEIFEEISDSVANIYDIPLDIFYGEKTEKSNSNNDFITYAVDFYYELIEDGFNTVIVGKDDYIAGEYVRFNRFSIFHRDILDSANGIDKLISNTFSRNEVNKFLKLPHIDEDWADEHNLTKNYANVKGGENNNE